MGARVLVVGLDGADWAILDPLLAEGACPHLASVIEQGARATLRSTVPPITFPAWSSFLTGVNPGRHGLLDFVAWTPGRYDLRFVSGSHRRVPTLLERLDQAGLAAAAVGFPGTWPPPRLKQGFVLAGFDAPVAIGPGPDFAWPRPLYERLVRRHGPWVYADVDELKVGPRWYRGARRALLAGLRRKARLAEALLEERHWDLFAVHVGETDTAGHHFLALHDPASPRRPERVDPVAAGTLRDVYCAADRFLGRLLHAAGAEAVLVASDHGMVGSSDRVFHLNRALHAGGFTELRHPGHRARLGDGVRRALLRHLPARTKEWIFRQLRSTASRMERERRLGGVDLAASAAFSEETGYAPSVRLNVRGRDPCGVVAPDEVEGVRRAVSDWLLALRDPDDGQSLVARVDPREAVLWGPAVEAAPDLYLTLGRDRGYTWTLLPSAGPGPYVTRLEGRARLGGKGRGTVGVHRPEGVLILSGAGVDLPRVVPIWDCAPTLLELCGVKPPPGLDGRSLLSPACPQPAASTPAPVVPAQLRQVPPLTYGPEEEAVVAARLRALGYLE
ncbi:MAG: hypothetical protein D6729_01960 [Deltaproteobacteria bacterium]|nr:MAG: hypothetical protein D6729_01960 [Deltaproteobacteria bacterium]